MINLNSTGEVAGNNYYKIKELNKGTRKCIVEIEKGIYDQTFNVVYLSSSKLINSRP